jgi:hypothetical protein
VDHEKHSKPNKAGPAPPDQELAQNPATDEFFTRRKSDMHHPKPGQEEVSAAVQRLALEVDSE